MFVGQFATNKKNKTARTCVCVGGGGGEQNTTPPPSDFFLNRTARGISIKICHKTKIHLYEYIYVKTLA